jgi:sugar phosphate permease
MIRGLGALFCLSGFYLRMARFSGVLGAVTAEVPLRSLIDGFGWKSVMAASGVVMLIISLEGFLFYQSDPVGIAEGEA